jgi:hypothetical protein
MGNMVATLHAQAFLSKRLCLEVSIRTLTFRRSSTLFYADLSFLISARSWGRADSQVETRP